VKRPTKENARERLPGLDALFDFVRFTRGPRGNNNNCRGNNSRIMARR
jgi:hypothetical protein